MYMKLVYVVYTGSSMSCLQFVYRGSCCHNLSAAHKKCFTACATCSGLIRPLVLVCKLYTRSRKACRPVARAPLVREFSNVAAILRLDWARPPPFYTRTRDPFPRCCALRELRNSRVLNSRAARLRSCGLNGRAVTIYRYKL